MSKHFIVLLVAIAVPALADIYKWVDDNGKVHYSDTPPPTQTKQGMAELNKQGQIIKRTEGILTPEQQAARDAQQAKDREAQAKLQEQKRRDHALLNSFSNTREIDEVRDRSIDSYQAAITANQSRREAMQKRLEEYNKQAARYTGAKKPVPVPPDLISSINDIKDEITKLDNATVQRNQDIEQVKARAEEDKKRLIELKGPDANKS
jgi:hypothetical protein